MATQAQIWVPALTAEGRASLGLSLLTSKTRREAGPARGKSTGGAHHKCLVHASPMSTRAAAAAAAAAATGLLPRRTVYAWH